ncbi:N-terminal domain of NEFA-interacting nuclear protein NIP30-domain-containing protein [Butyriboletus roseoflavus]|nr:N-terminal domain of NEFA-interacting nuclear protein NIP30-domain-containing protein [Butyriboletus roseoflavus]
MEEGVPTVAVTGVASRFVSQTDIEAARSRRDEQWKAAYARFAGTVHTTPSGSLILFRLGQEPPPQPIEDVFDGRSLAEKLAANRAAKQEEWEEKTKLANQFRALEEDEIMFLDSIREKQAEEERLRRLQDGEELSDFRKAVAARENAINNPPPVVLKPTAPSKPSSDGQIKVTMPAPKKEASVKKALKGVIVKKKPKGERSLALSPTPTSVAKHGDDAPPDAKRRKTSIV